MMVFPMKSSFLPFSFYLLRNHRLYDYFFWFYPLHLHYRIKKSQMLEGPDEYSLDSSLMRMILLILWQLYYSFIIIKKVHLFAFQYLS